MSHPRPGDGQPPTDQDVEELRNSAIEMGVEDAEERDPDEVVKAVRHAHADSEVSPSEWREKDDD